MAKTKTGKKGFDPLGQEVAEWLSITEPAVTPQQLLEVVMEHLEKQLPGTLHGKARQNVISLLVDNEYRYDFKTHMRQAYKQRKNGRWAEANANDNTERVDQLVQSHRDALDDEAEPDKLVKDIDQPIAAGNMTRLHVASMDGEYNEVIRLVEEESARLDVRDNCGFTPSQRAHAMGHTKIELYLDAKMKAAGIETQR